MLREAGPPLPHGVLRTILTCTHTTPKHKHPATCITHHPVPHKSLIGGTGTQSASRHAHASAHTGQSERGGLFLLTDAIRPRPGTRGLSHCVFFPSIFAGKEFDLSPAPCSLSPHMEKSQAGSGIHSLSGRNPQQCLPVLPHKSPAIDHDTPLSRGIRGIRIRGKLSPWR